MHAEMLGLMAKIYRIVLQVSGIEAATRFYGELFGLAGERVSAGRHYFNCGGVILACFDPRRDGDGFDARANSDHVYFAVDGLELFFERARELGCQELGASIERRPWGERSFYAKD